MEVHCLLVLILRIALIKMTINTNELNVQVYFIQKYMRKCVYDIQISSQRYSLRYGGSLAC